MATKFGNTWWGQAWLQSLTHIDYANRIPRGTRYARNGSVREVKIDGNVIRAKVMGSCPTPYNVTIEVSQFSNAEIKRFIDELLRHPALISNLLNRELDPIVSQIAEKCKLKIFPSRWDDLKMHCSCPDWAVPCKHLAAVIYMVSQEIDNNPFLVFEMHGIHILDKLKSRGVLTSQSVAEVENINNAVQVETENTDASPTIASRHIDFARITDRLEALMLLLPDNPPFCTDGNFKDVYCSEIRRISKTVKRFLAGKTTSERMFPDATSPAIVTTTSDISFKLNSKLQYAVSVKGDLCLALLQINPDFLPDYEPSVIAAHEALLFAMHLLAKGCVAPNIVQLSDKNYSIYWQPAYIASDVKNIRQSLDCMIPRAMMNYVARGKKGVNTIADKADWLVTYFLNQFVKSLSGNTNKTELYQLFFKGEPIAFDGIGEQGRPEAIKAWTDHLRLTVNDYCPVFSIDEAAQGFDLHIGVNDTQQGQQATVSLAEVLTYEKYDSNRFAILHNFTMLSSMMKEVNDYINSGAEQPIHFNSKTFVPFLLNVIPAIQLLGIKVFLPKSLSSLLRPKASVHITSKKEEGRSAFGLFDLFNFTWQVALGDQIVSREEFDHLQLKADQLIRFKQSYIYASEDDIKRLTDAFTKSDHLSPSKLLQAALTGEYESAPVTLSPEVKSLIKKLTEQDAISIPDGLNATLRPYQERGFSWMYRNMKLGFGSILADDMGLGKTLQSITLMLKLKQEGALDGKHILVIAPTGLLTNWAAELQRFAPQLTVFTYHGGGRNVKTFTHNVMLTSYGVVRSDSTKLKKMEWRVVFIDEAQNIKNRDTAQSKAVNSIPADSHIALSGTPVENRLSEFWSIMDFANKGYLDTPKNFNEQFAKPIQMSGDEQCAARFRKLTAPFMMRRMKTDKTIIADLPDKIELNDYATLKSEQAALYQKTLDAAMQEIEGVDTTDSQSLFKRQGLILQMILALKQICNHPAQFLKNDDQRLELSGKSEMLMDRIESIIDAGEKALVFTQFREMGDMLVRFVEERTGERPMFLHGGCSVKERQQMVDRFQSDKSARIFILSLKAAGTGLNLTAATHVIHYDLWWNPAVEAQATDRAYRIGQQHNVMVHRFITQGTFEERINEMIQQKRHLADMTVASGESWIGKLSNKELREIFH